MSERDVKTFNELGCAYEEAIAESLVHTPESMTALVARLRAIMTKVPKQALFRYRVLKSHIEQLSHDAELQSTPEKLTQIFNAVSIIEQELEFIGSFGTDTPGAFDSDTTAWTFARNRQPADDRNIFYALEQSAFLNAYAEGAQRAAAAVAECTGGETDVNPDVIFNATRNSQKSLPTDGIIGGLDWVQ